jgi:hypothetical protein
MNSESKESILFIKQTSAMLFAQGFQLSKIPPNHSPPLPFSPILWSSLFILKLDFDIDNMSMAVDREKSEIFRLGNNMEETHMTNNQKLLLI